MMRKGKHLIIAILLSFLFCITGCVDVFQDLTQSQVIYEQHPTKISYHISYGYQLFLNGSGTSTVVYREDIPDSLMGTITNISIFHESQSTIVTNAGNDMVIWNETFQDTQHLFLGVSADVISETMMIPDLSGIHARTISEIQSMHSALVQNYCNVQGNDTEILINPQHQQIRQIALNVKKDSGSNNSFQLAKDLFSWLKSNTGYETHLYDQQIQSCETTLEKRTGDCDDLSFLYISLCRAISIPSRFIRGYLITTHDNSIQVIPHVWVEVYCGNNLGNNGWIPVECAGTGALNAELHQNFGIQDAHHLKLYTDDGSNESMQVYTNHISVEYGSGLTIDIENKAMIENYTVIETQKLCVTDDSYRSYC